MKLQVDMFKKQRSLIVIGLIVVIGILFALIYLFVIRDKTTVSISKTSVKSINVKMEGMLTNDYKDSRLVEFSVEDDDSISDLIDTIELYYNRDKSLDEVMMATRFTFLLQYDDGSTKDYTMQKYTSIDDSKLRRVLGSEQVLRQIRRVFYVNLDEVSNVYFYHWEDKNSEEAVKEKLSVDKTVLKTLLDISQREVLLNPWKVLDNTDYGLVMENKEGETVLALNIWPEMATYKELLEVLPEIQQYIKK